MLHVASVGSARRAVTLAGLFVGLILVVGSGVVGAQTPQGATLTVVTGISAVLRSNGAQLQPAPSGTSLLVRDQVGTLAQSSALLTFFEGSELEMGADTSIVLNEIRVAGNNEVHVTVENVLGSTVARVRSFANPSSEFRLQDPGGRIVAIARGSTIFGRSYATGEAVFGFTDCHVRTCEVRAPGVQVNRLGSAAVGCDGGGNCRELRFTSIYEVMGDVPSGTPATEPVEEHPGGEPGGGEDDDKGHDDGGTVSG